MNPNAGLVGTARKLVRKLGYDVVHHQDFGVLLRHLAIDLLIDVGANEGQTRDKVRLSGYQGPIVSFEPHPECFQRLSSRPDEFQNWRRLNIPLGLEDKDDLLYFGHTTNQASLSTGALSGPQYGSIPVRVRSLDSLWPELGLDAYQRSFLKIDAEGLDFQILKGARNRFDRIAGGMVELRPIPEYSAESPMVEVLSFLSENGFVVCRIDLATFDTQTGVGTSFDVTFCKWSILKKP